MPTNCLKLHGEKLSCKQISVFHFFSLGTSLSKQRHMIYVICLFFQGEFDAIIFILIWRQKDGLEHREGHPGGVQREDLMFPLWAREVIHLITLFLW